jgi:hypothetical protein
MALVPIIRGDHLSLDKSLPSKRRRRRALLKKNMFHVTRKSTSLKTKTLTVKIISKKHLIV